LALIPEDKIAEIRDRTDIVQVIGEYVSLRRSGVNYKGLCPFHGEKTPSFNVNSAKQIFHCFGCGKSGDVIRFVMEHDAKPFVEVVKEMARRAGIDLPEPEISPAAREAQRRAEGDRARLLRVVQLACDFFRAQYAAPVGERARAYVEGRRGIGAEVRERFLLGYAPPGWDSLVRHLEAKKVPHEVAEAAGLVRAREHARLAPGAPPTKATHFDLFRDRVICPLINAQGDVIAFSGRTLPDDKPADPNAPPAPKYINSPESPIYRKGENLYGLHVARPAIRRADRAILVEGNFDVLMMHERGFSETVAPMGTAFTASQAHLLHRAGPARVYMLLDGDAAGGSAAARNVGIFLDEDLLSFVAALPRGEDPDTFLAKNGAEALELLLKRSVESVEYFCTYEAMKRSPNPAESGQLLDEVAGLLRKLKIGATRQRYIEQLALSLAMPVDQVRDMVRGGPAPRPRQAAAAAAPAAQGNVPPAALDAIDLEIIAVLADHPRLMFQRRHDISHCTGDPSLRAALEALGERTGGARFEPAALGDALDPALRSKALAAAMSGRYADVADGERVLNDLLRRREEQRDFGEYKEKLAAVRAAIDPSEKLSLNSRIQELNEKHPNFGRWANSGIAAQSTKRG
jgi:DNA primase